MRHFNNVNQLNQQAAARGLWEVVKLLSCPGTTPWNHRGKAAPLCFANHGCGQSAVPNTCRTRHHRDTIETWPRPDRDTTETWPRQDRDILSENVSGVCAAPGRLIRVRPQGYRFWGKTNENDNSNIIIIIIIIIIILSLNILIFEQRQTLCPFCTGRTGRGKWEAWLQDLWKSSCFLAAVSDLQPNPLIVKKCSRALHEIRHRPHFASREGSFQLAPHLHSESRRRFSCFGWWWGRTCWELQNCAGPVRRPSARPGDDQPLLKGLDEVLRWYMLRVVRMNFLPN